MTSTRWGVVCDVDGLFGLNALRHPLRAALRVARRDRNDLRSVLGMAAVLLAVVDAQPDAPVVYLTTASRRLSGPLDRALRRDGYPRGTVETPTVGAAPRPWSRNVTSHKQDVLQRLATDHPQVRWVLVGDDGDDDPDLYGNVVRRFPGQVAAIALRRVSGSLPPAGPGPCGEVGDVPVLRAADGQELAPLLRTSLALRRPEAHGVRGWFLTAPERGNESTALRSWTEGNDVRPLVHGRTYYPALAAELADTGTGDLVTVTAWRADGDERLADDGPTVVQALIAALRRGVWCGAWCGGPMPGGWGSPHPRTGASPSG